MLYQSISLYSIYLNYHINILTTHTFSSGYYLTCITALLFLRQLLMQNTRTAILTKCSLRIQRSVEPGQDVEWLRTSFIHTKNSMTHLTRKIPFIPGFKNKKECIDYFKKYNLIVLYNLQYVLKSKFYPANTLFKCRRCSIHCNRHRTCG